MPLKNVSSNKCFRTNGTYKVGTPMRQNVSLEMIFSMKCSCTDLTGEHRMVMGGCSTLSRTIHKAQTSPPQLSGKKSGEARVIPAFSCGLIRLILINVDVILPRNHRFYWVDRKIGQSNKILVCAEAATVDLLCGGGDTLCGGGYAEGWSGSERARIAEIV